MKRRKTTTGLNSRFDRMMETVNVLHTSPASSISSRSHRRRRATSSSSASAAEYELPRTPVDAYSELHGGRLGAGFSVMKMRGHESSTDLGFSDSFGRYAFDKPASRKPPSIPAWLSNTLSTLDTHHPLRRLMPVDSTLHEAAPTATLGLPEEPVDSGRMPSHALPAEQNSNHESIFAFNAPGSPATEHTARANVLGLPASGNPANDFNTERGTLLGHGELPTVPPHCSPSPDAIVPADSLMIPFSTPGPASCVSAVLPSRFHLGSTCGSANSFLVSLHEAILAEDNEHEQHVRAFSQSEDGLGASASDQPALLDVAATNARGDIFDIPLGDNLNGDLGLSMQRPSLEPAPRIYSTAPECYGSMRSVGGAIDQTPSSSPSLNDVMLPSMWQSAANADADLSPIQRTAEANALQAWARERNSPRTPAPVSVTPVRSTPTRPVRVYFDSPAEDPAGSDPLEPESYVLPADLASIDFRWEKFDRGRFGETHTPGFSPYGTDLCLAPTPRTPPALDDQSIPRTPILATARSSSSSGIPTFHEESPEESTGNGETWIVPTAVVSSATYPTRGHRAASGHTAESASRPLQSVFAPAPGIFLSPLRKVGENNKNPPPQVGTFSLF